MTNTLLAGSHRQPYRNAKATGQANPDERFEISVLVRRQAAAELTDHVARLARGDRSAGHLTRQAFDTKFGASAADIEAVSSFAQRHGLTVTSHHAGRRTVILSGTVAQFNAAFGVNLQQFDYDDGTYRGRTGDITLPPELHGVVEAVLGLDNRPAARPHFRRNATGSAKSYTPLQIASLYQFPAGNGAGETIAIIELGGGYRPADLKTYFAAIGVAPAPKVTSVSVDHATNKPAGGADGPDGEVLLDIEVAGAVAPGAHLAVYFAPNTDAGFLDAITTAVHDTVNTPSIISISWGGPESSWTAQATTAFDSAFQAAAAIGITVLVASGDSGSNDGATDGSLNVDFPASSPHATGCGGSHIATDGTTITAESVWNDGTNGGAGGGGISTVFATPAWQSVLTVTDNSGTRALANRGVPDVAGDADPESGYQVRVDGTNTVIGGTSAVAPLWAGLIARINAIKGSPVGLINPALYANQAALNDITTGNNDITSSNNGAYRATKGWDAASGLGSPIGTALEKVL